MKLMPCLVLIFIAASCATTHVSKTEAKARERMQSLDQESQDNINMLIDMIDEQSSVKDPGARRWIPYEFRIPLDSAKKNQVQRIDRSVTFTKRADSYQCIGEHATKENVFKIVSLPFAYRIKFCHSNRRYYEEATVMVSKFIEINIIIPLWKCDRRHIISIVKKQHL